MAHVTVSPPILLGARNIEANKPIVGGLCISQAERYSRLAEVESVHALSRVMDDVNAGKGGSLSAINPTLIPC